MGAELRVDVLTAPVRADLVVPSEGIGPPVLDLLVLVIKAEVEVDVREVLASVDTAAHVGGTLGIRLVKLATGGTQGRILVIAGESIVADHVVKVGSTTVGGTLFGLTAIPFVGDIGNTVGGGNGQSQGESRFLHFLFNIYKFHRELPFYSYCGLRLLEIEL